MERLLLLGILGILLSACDSEGEIRPLKDVTIIVLYDNYQYDDRLRTGWGFSCLVRLRGQSILFDTGGDGATLLYNMEQLEIDPKEIDAVMLSHIHSDHVGGVLDFLNRNSDVTLYLPKSFPESFKKEISSGGARVEEVSQARELLPNVYTTGEMGAFIKEQSLILNTAKGLVVITGCAHPGIVNIVQRAKQLLGGVPFFVMGGFHLFGMTERELKRIISDFKELGVVKVGPCHCSGRRARHLFKEAYGKDYLELGVGRVITIGVL